MIDEIIYDDNFLLVFLFFFNYYYILIYDGLIDDNKRIISNE